MSEEANPLFNHNIRIITGMDEQEINREIRRLESGSMELERIIPVPFPKSAGHHTIVNYLVFRSRREQ